MSRTWRAFWWGFFHPFATKAEHYKRAVQDVIDYPVDGNDEQ